MNQRTCIVSRNKLNQDRMIRFVAAPDGQIVADLKRNLPGRGVWTRAHRATVRKAVEKELFGRGLKRKVVVSPELDAEVEKLMEKTALASLGLVKKAGQCVLGATKAANAMGAGKAIALLHAGDAAEDGIRKLDRTACVSRRNGTEVPVLRMFDSVRMSSVLGSGNVMHVALTKGGAAKSFLKLAKALDQYRDDVPQTR